MGAMSLIRQEAGIEQHLKEIQHVRRVTALEGLELARRIKIMIGPDPLLEITRERVRQIWQIALRKLNERLESNDEEE